MTSTPTFSDDPATGSDPSDPSGWPDTGGQAVTDDGEEINPRTGRPYTQPKAERLKIGQMLAEARKNRARERGAKPGSRNHVSGKATRAPRTAGTAPRATPAKKAAESVEDKAYRGAEKVVGWMSLGGAFAMAKDPVRGAIVIGQAEALAPILQSLIDENERVRDALASLHTMAGPAGAWGDAAAWAGATVGALALTGPKVPGGLVGTVLSTLGGAVLDQAIQRASMAMATRPGPAGGTIDPAVADEVYGKLLAHYGRPRPGPTPAGQP